MEQPTLRPLVSFERFDEGVIQDFLAGRSERLACQWPLLPPAAPGLDAPGPNVVNLARTILAIPTDEAEKSYLEDLLAIEEQREAGLKRRDYKARAQARYHQLLQISLVQVYAQLLYDPRFDMTVKVRHNIKPARCIPGHVWGPALANRSVCYGPLAPVPVLVVGKHPGPEEIARGCNFIGNTSQSFQDLLEEAELSDYVDWYVTNIIRHQNVSDSGSVSKVWIKDGLPLAQSELLLTGAPWVLLLGSEPIKAFLGEKASYKTHAGRVHELRLDARQRPDEAERWHTCKAVVCHHPAALLHDPELRSEIQEALRFFAFSRTGQVEVEVPTDYRILRTLPELQALVQELLDTARHEFAIDAEWHGPRPAEPGAYLRTLQFSWGVGKAAALVLRAAGGAWAFGGTQEEILLELRRLLARPEVRIIGHNFNADLLWLTDFGLDFLEEQFEVPEDDPPEAPDWQPGWLKMTQGQGGFETMLAAHAVEETADFGLKELCRRWCGMAPWELELDDWIGRYCSEQQIARTRLPGFGECPDEILLPYSLKDADGSFRLYRKLADKLLNQDRYGLCSWKPFWLAQRASLAYLEMHRHGILVDLDRVNWITDSFEQAHTRLLTALRQAAGWEDFNPASIPQCRELLFGEEFNGAAPTKEGQRRRLRPEGALTLRLTPYKTTGKRPKLWYRVEEEHREGTEWPAPSTDKESLVALADPSRPVVGMLRDLRYVEQLLKIIHPAAEGTSTGPEEDEDGEEFEKGILQYLQSDKRIRSHCYQTTETGRTRSSKPNMQNVSFKKRAKDFKRILKWKDADQVEHNDHKFPVQAIFRSKPGTLLIEADYAGAELMVMAIQANDRNMIAHCQRSKLPDDHPDTYDIHGAVAIRAFKIVDPETGLPLPPKKAVLEAKGFKHLRDAAKPVDFGYAYGMVAETACRRAREEGVMLSIEEAEALIAGLEAEYPSLPKYYGECRYRASDPGWLATCFGRYRRFPRAANAKQRGELERQAMNFPIQCLRKGSFVLTDSGYCRIEKLIDGESVQFPCAFGNGQGVAVASGRKSLLRLKTKRNLPIDASRGHVFFVYQEDQIVEKRADELRVGDWLVESHTHVDGGKKPCSVEEAYLAGYLIGDGSFQPARRGPSKHPYAMITTGNRFLAELLTAMSQHLYGSGSMSDQYKPPHNVVYRIQMPKPFRDLMEKLGLRHATTDQKIVPDSWLCWSSELRCALLAGLLDAEGEFRLDVKSGVRVTFTNTSFDVAQKVYLLLSSLGFAPNWKGPYRNGPHKPFYRVTVSGPQIYRLLAVLPCRRVESRIPITGNVREAHILPGDLAKRIGERLHYAAKWTNQEHCYIRRARKFHYGTPAMLGRLCEKAGIEEPLLRHRFVQLTSVEEIDGEDETFDVCIRDGRPAFTAQGLLVHNSAVSDIVNTAIANLRRWRRQRSGVPFDILMQIHDALLFQVEIPYVAPFLQEVLPACMESVPVWPTRLDGSLQDDDNAPYFLGVGYAVMEFWGESLSAARAAELGLPAGLKLKNG